MTLKRAAFVYSLPLLFTALRAAAQEPPASQPAAEPPPVGEPPPGNAEPEAPLPAPPTAAEQPPEGPVETIVVTGSTLRRKDLNTPAPVTIMTRAQWEESGKLTLGDFLQSLPEQGNAPNFQLNNGGATYGAEGSTRISLRSLGVARTLVLVNGRRMVNSGLGASPAVDLNSIPAVAVERVEVLKDGASAIYGSDAIAGVVNIITRKFTGTEATAQYGISTHGDAQTVEVDAITGHSGALGNVLFAAGYFDQGDSFLRDRDWSAVALSYDYTNKMTSSGGSFRTPQGIVGLPATDDGKPLPACLANALCKGLVDSDPNWATDSFVRDPSAPLGWRVQTDADLYNFASVNYLTIPSNRLQLFSSGDTAGKLVKGYYEASYVQRSSQQNAAPMPLNPGDYTIGGGDTPISVSPDSLYNPFGVSPTFAGRRLVEFGNRTYSEDLGTLHLVVGVNGELPEDAGPLQGWSWDMNVNYGRTEGTFTTGGAIRNSRIADAVGPSMMDMNGNPVCVSKAGDLSTIIPGCVPLNLFGGPNNGSISPAQIDNLGFTGTSRAFDELLGFSVSASGDLFKFPSGRAAALGFGYSYRRQKGAQIADPIAASGDSADFNFKSTEGDFHVNEVYGELSLPLISGVPGARTVEVDIAGRFVDYNTFGNNFSGKIGARYTPISDITLRGTYSTAFRAPSISELFLGQSETAPTASDPCAILANAPAELVTQCRATGVPAAGSGDQGMQELARQGGNTQLKAETAKIFTVGVVVQPQVVKDLSFTLDYYHIDVDDLIGTIGVASIIAGCYPGADGTPNQDYCALIHRAPESGRILFVNDVNQNVGTLNTAGVDVAVRYDLRTKVGRFGFVVDANWLAYFDRTQTTGTGTQTIHGKGTYDLGALPDLKANFAVNWGYKGFGAGGILHWIGSFKECGTPETPDSPSTSDGGLCYVADNLPSRDVGSNAWLDLHASYSFKSGSLGRTTFVVGVNNITDTSPQFVYSAALANSDPSVYDYLGRYFYTRIKQSF